MGCFYTLSIVYEILSFNHLDYILFGNRIEKIYITVIKGVLVLVYADWG